jgi:hypothetical protein
MKRTLWAAFLLVGFGYANAGRADTIEVLLGHIFVPQTGYGSNNNVEITLDGYLPNSCYQLGRAVVQGDPRGRAFVVRQYAERETTGICAQGSSPPGRLADVVPYTYDLSLGRLPAGNYTVSFDPGSSDPRSVEFNVYQSQQLTRDDLPYAPVTAVLVQDVNNGLYPVNVVLSGAFTSTCQTLSQIKITRESEVTVIQPILNDAGQAGGGNCVPKLVPFQRTVAIGRFPEGRYAVHVRTMSGKSISHAFSIVMPDP